MIERLAIVRESDLQDLERKAALLDSLDIVCVPRAAYARLNDEVLTLRTDLRDLDAHATRLEVARAVAENQLREWRTYASELESYIRFLGSLTKNFERHTVAIRRTLHHMRTLRRPKTPTS